MERMRWIAGFVLGFVLVGAGLMKFTSGHAFQYLEAQTGLEFLHPYVNNMVGFAEITAGVMIRFRRTRRYGAYGALAIAGGAVLAHLTPWLGISTPNGFVDGAAAPWDRADFTAATTSSLFITALVTLALALFVAGPELRQQRKRHSPTSAEVAELDGRSEAVPA